MEKKIVSCLMVCIVIILAYFYAHVNKNSYLYDRNADTGTFYSTGIMMEDEELTQTFVSEEDTIDGLNIKAAIIGNAEDVVVNYAILDVDSENVFKGRVRATELENNKFNQLEISKITDAKGKTYTIVLSEEKSDEQNGVAFYIEPGRYGNQQLIIKGNETDGTLAVRSICHRFDVETFVVLLGMIAFITAFMKVLYKFFK